MQLNLQVLYKLFLVNKFLKRNTLFHGTWNIITVNNSVFSAIMPCNLLKVNRYFGGTYFLNLQVRRISEVRNQGESGSKQSNRFAEISDYIGNRKEILVRKSVLVDSPTGQNEQPVPIATLSVNRLLCLLPTSRGFISWLILLPWRWRRHVPIKRRLIFNRLHGVVSKKI
jgi:hypothetical protein